MLRRAVTALTLGLGVAWLGAMWAIDRAGLQDTSVPSDVIVVLGARVLPDGTPSPTLRARVEHAVLLFGQGLAPKLLFSGGVGDFGGSEASVARELAVSLGVPRAACEVEEQSHSTAQNAHFSRLVLEHRRWRSAVIVTDPSHLPRALQLFEDEGVQATGSPTLAAPRHVSSLQRLWWTSREVAAWVRLVTKF